MSICVEFLSDRRERVVVDSAASQWEVRWVLFHLFYIPAKGLSWLRTDYLPLRMTSHYWQSFASQRTDLLLLRLLINRDLARIQEWRNHSCMILNSNKTNSLVIT